MKKITALLLALLLLLPTMAMAEILEFDDFTLEIKDGDLYELGTKTEGDLLFILYPAYDPNATFYPNINCTWVDDSIADTLKTTTAMEMAEVLLSNAMTGYAQQGIVATNGKVVNAEGNEEHGYLITYTTTDVDYSGLGVDLQCTLHQLQAFMPLGGNGTYIFTFTATSEEILAGLTEYIDAIQEK